MKKILFAFLLVVTINVHSQVSWNAKVGTNISSQNGSGIDTKLGYQLGIGLDYFFTKNWGIQPSIMMISKGYKTKGNYLQYTYNQENNTATKYDITENLIYIEIPIMVAYKFEISNDFNMILNGGPYLSYGIAGKYKNKRTLKDNTIDEIKVNAFSGNTRKFDTGVGVGTTLEYLNKYTVSLLAEWGLRNVVSDEKNQTYGISLGYKF